MLRLNKKWKTRNHSYKLKLKQISRWFARELLLLQDLLVVVFSSGRCRIQQLRKEVQNSAWPNHSKVIGVLVLPQWKVLVLSLFWCKACCSTAISCYSFLSIVNTTEIRLILIYSLYYAPSTLYFFSMQHRTTRLGPLIHSLSNLLKSFCINSLVKCTLQKKKEI